MSPEPPEVTVSARLLMRMVIVLVAFWSLAEGLVLLAFQGAATGALGAGVEDEGGQRLLGAHLLILIPAYLLIAWRLDRYYALVWLPLAAQAGAALVVGFSMLNGTTAIGDGILPFAVGLIFVTLLGY